MADPTHPQLWAPPPCDAIHRLAWTGADRRWRRRWLAGLAMLGLSTAASALPVAASAPGAAAAVAAVAACHTEAAEQVMATPPGTGPGSTPPAHRAEAGQEIMLNSFCIGDRSNEPFCQSCHIGYGWKDASFDFKAEGQGRLPGLPPQRRLQQAARHGRRGAHRAHRAASGFGQVRRTGRPGARGAGGGQDGCGQLRQLPLLRRRRRRRQTRRPRQLADARRPCAGRAHGAQGTGGAGFSCATCHQADGHRIAGSRVQMTRGRPARPGCAAPTKGAALPPASPATATSRTGNRCWRCSG
jgi:hypothetical protein